MPFNESTTKLPSSTRRAPTKAERNILGTQHFEHQHNNTWVHLMASDDHDERVRGALTVALVVFLTYINTKRHRARTLAEWALALGMP